MAQKSPLWQLLVSDEEDNIITVFDSMAESFVGDVTNFLIMSFRICDVSEFLRLNLESKSKVYCSDIMKLLKLRKL